MGKLVDGVIAIHSFCDSKGEETFGLLYDAYAPALYGVICKLVPDTLTADKILGETIYRIWATYYTYQRAKCTPLIWMTRIAIQQCKKYSPLSNEDVYAHLLTKKPATVV